MGKFPRRGCFVCRGECIGGKRAPSAPENDFAASRGCETRRIPPLPQGTRRAPEPPPRCATPLVLGPGPPPAAPGRSPRAVGRLVCRCRVCARPGGGGRIPAPAGQSRAWNWPPLRCLLSGCSRKPKVSSDRYMPPGTRAESGFRVIGATERAGTIGRGSPRPAEPAPTSDYGWAASDSSSNSSSAASW